ncbi:hypothetical protein ZIOFF_066475 [Zingiber officinale]|uniref:Uncharacterized protein n=1 Tax=Zingiber officinale TaxID=94328 RepID=A0A8J5F331_ZINOF|nr:hypothetical protein ZIOFF_066475 [Zingiber officinale]
MTTMTESPTNTAAPASAAATTMRSTKKQKTPPASPPHPLRGFRPPRSPSAKKTTRSSRPVARLVSSTLWCRSASTPTPSAPAPSSTSASTATSETSIVEMVQVL